MGRSDYDPFAAGKQHRDFFTCNSSDSDRNLFYDPHKIFAGQAFPGYDKSTYGKKGNKGQSFHISDADRLDGYQSRHGKSGRRCGGNLGRRCRCCVLDVGDCADRFLDRICGGDARTVTQGKRSLYGGYRGGPAYYIHHFCEEKLKKKKKHVLIAVLFAISGLICWCGISQVISNSVVSSFENAFGIPPLYTTIVLVAIAAVIVLRKNATVKVLDVVVPVMAVCYFAITIFIILKNIGSIPAVFGRIFEEAFGLRQAVSGGFGAVLMNGIKRGLFSNEAGSGSAPCAAAAAECETPVSAGLTQALGVFVDTIVICSCTAMIMLTAPENVVAGKEGMDLLQSAMRYHLGEFGVIFIAVTLFLFSFSTFLGILFYARSNVAYLFGDKWIFQTLYKILALIMLFIGGIAAYTFVWDLGDVGIGLMTIFNTGILYLLGGQALTALKEFESTK